MIDLLHADFSQRVVLMTDALPWLPSPQPGVERRLLDRIGGEVARATSIVRYAPDSVFPPHAHALGEEFLVLDGVFSDEHGDYPAGTYVRNPPGSVHAPFTEPGCVILVKLRQMPRSETARTIADINPIYGKVQAAHVQLPLYEAGSERVTIERLAPGAEAPATTLPRGEEIFVLSGELSDEYGSYGTGSWIRNPAGHDARLRSRDGAIYWAKRGHLPEIRP